jgi:hypothetical protein
MYVHLKNRGSENMAAGRPKKPLKYNYELIKDLASILCTQDEIANIMGVSVRKLQMDEQFMRLYKEGIDGAKAHIRRAQFKLALSGNATMLVWLGKQFLGQREPQAEVVVPDDELEEDMSKYDK